MGRKTYEQVLDFGDYPYEGKRSFVFTHRKTPSPKGGYVEFVSGDIAGFTESLRKNEKGDIWLVGGAQIIRILLEHELIDDIIVSVHPIILGKGIPLFDRIGKEVRTELVDILRFDSGLVQLYYRLAR